MGEASEARIVWNIERVSAGDGGQKADKDAAPAAA
jgi:hypothetical protein